VKTIRVAIFNDYQLIVEGLAAVLQQHPQIELRQISVKTERLLHPVDVVLYDVFATNRRQITMPAALVPRPRGVKVVMFGWQVSPRLVAAGLEQGFDGYLDKSLTGNVIVSAIARISAGEKVVEHGTGWSGSGGSSGWPGQQEGLTLRESEILVMVTQGLSNEEVAASLLLSPNTIKTHIRKAYKKMGVSRRGEAVAWGATHGFVVPDYAGKGPTGPRDPRPGRVG
jgi:DNA-binding NarL/FixJ family response regulator